MGEEGGQGRGMPRSRTSRRKAANASEEAFQQAREQLVQLVAMLLASGSSCFSADDYDGERLSLERVSSCCSADEKKDMKVDFDSDDSAFWPVSNRPHHTIAAAAKMERRRRRG